MICCNSPALAECKVHLLNVYFCLLLGMVFCFYGGYASLRLEALKDNLALFVGTFMFVMALLFSPPTDDCHLSVITFLVFAGFTGALMRYPIQRLLHLDPQFVSLLAVETLCTFVFFTSWALLSSKDRWLGLADVLLVALNYLLCLSGLNLFLQSPKLHQLNVYIGFLINCAYVLHDTQLTLKQCHKNATSTQALNFFLDVCGLFFHSLAITLMQRGERWADLQETAGGPARVRFAM